MLERIGKYEIRLQLGRGGMGVVYEGFDPSIERRVAIKTLRTEFIEDDQLAEFLERFRREAKSAGRLSHPHIVTIYEYGEEAGMPYIVMEYVTGRDLSEDLKRGVRYALPDVVRIMTQLLSALAHAHENGVVHRDIKPANILLLEDGSLKVVDFGIARIEEAESFTKSGVVIGTPSYMAPEQILGLPASARSDVFSCGVLLYQLLTGDRPFTGDEYSVKQKVLKMDPMPPSELNPTLGPPWDAVVSRAMAKKPEARYDGARQFLEAIRAVSTAEGRAGEEARRKAMEAEEHAQREAEARSRAAAAKRAEEERLAAVAEERAKAEAERREEMRRHEDQLRVERERVARLETEASARAEAAERARREAGARAESAKRDAEAAVAGSRAPEPARTDAGPAKSRAPAVVAVLVALGVGFAAWLWQRSAQDETAQLEAARVAAEAKAKTEAGERAKVEALAREEAERRARLEAEVANREADAKRETERLAAARAEEEAKALAAKKEEEEKRRAEAAAKKEADARAKVEALAAAEAKRKAEEAVRRETEEKAKADAAAKADEANLAARRPGRVFRDCPDCPQMVVIPAGEFMMGSSASEVGRDSDEGPQRLVKIAQPFAMARSEVTVGEFRRFVEEAGYITEAERDVGNPGCRTWDKSDGKFEWRAGRNWKAPGFDQSDRQPVVCVSWNDAKAYVRWLARKTGKGYRLPSESEWEYSARGGTSSARYWGENPSDACRYANVADQTTHQGSGWSEKHECNDGHWFPAPVASYQPNKFGLYDVLGNVLEWTEDCWNGSYAGAPSNGSPWLSGNCSIRVNRGGSWGNTPRYVRSANRYRYVSSDRSYDLGFRPARTLE